MTKAIKLTNQETELLKDILVEYRQIVQDSGRNDPDMRQESIDLDVTLIESMLTKLEQGQ